MSRPRSVIVAFCTLDGVTGEGTVRADWVEDRGMGHGSWRLPQFWLRRADGQPRAALDYAKSVAEEEKTFPIRRYELQPEYTTVNRLRVYHEVSTA